MSKLPTNKIWWWLATWFGSGLSPKAPGTAGSLASLPFAYFVQLNFGNFTLLSASIMVFFAGWWASVQYMKFYPDKHDPKEIVVDEVAAMWLVLAVVVHNPHNFKMAALLYILSFALFRFFDAVKPWPISAADRKVKGGFGVMFDDILAANASIIVYLIGVALFLRFGV